MEVFLARLYTDEALGGAFLATPADIARRAGLDEDAVQALLLIDRDGLRRPATLASEPRMHAAANSASRDYYSDSCRES
jgi:hypothetical protein